MKCSHKIHMPPSTAPRDSYRRVFDWTDYSAPRKTKKKDEEENIIGMLRLNFNEVRVENGRIGWPDVSYNR